MSSHICSRFNNQAHTVDIQVNGLAFVLSFFVALTLLMILSPVFAAQAFADGAQVQINSVQQTHLTGHVAGGSDLDDSVANSDAQAFGEQDLLDAQMNHSEIDIKDADVPLSTISDADTSAFATLGSSSSNSSSNDSGSFVNAIIAVVCAISMILIMAILTRKARVDFKVLSMRIAAVAVGIVVISTWSLFDKLALPVQWFNNTSGIMIVLFAAYLIVAIASFVFESLMEQRLRAGKNSA